MDTGWEKMDKKTLNTDLENSQVEETISVSAFDQLAMLQGYSEHSVDDKGRIIIPQRFRDIFVRSCVITRGWNRSLFVFHSDTWQRIRSELLQLSFADQDAVRLQSFFIGVASEVDIDSQGRIAIPSHLREFAGISLPTSVTPSIVAVIGVPYRIEIWSKEVWKATSNEISDEAVFAAAKILDTKLRLRR